MLLWVFFSIKPRVGYCSLSVVFFQIWPHGEYPLIPVGRMVLNRNPKNYFSEVEQIAFAPSNMVPGIEASPDKMLQVRCQRYFINLIKITQQILKSLSALIKSTSFTGSFVLLPWHSHSQAGTELSSASCKLPVPNQGEKLPEGWPTMLWESRCSYNINI